MLKELIAKLETATEGSVDLDNRIALAVEFWPKEAVTDVVDTGDTFTVWLDDYTYDPAPRYTQSIDDALTLAPEGKPYQLNFDMAWQGPHARAVVHYSSANARTAPLAVCIAALRARQDMQESE